MASPTDLELIRLAASFYRYEAHRLQAARDEFGLSPVRFYQRVNELLADPDVELGEPTLVRMLRDQRDRRQRLKRAG